MNSGKKAIKLIIIVLIAAVAFGYGAYTTLRPGVYVGDDFLYEKSASRYEKDASNYIEQTSDHEFTIVSHDKKQEVSYEIEKEQITFYFPDQTISGSWDTEQKELYDNGVPVLQNGNFEFSEDGVNITPDMGQERCSYALCRIIYNDQETISKWYMNILGLILYILGIICVMYPEECYFFLKRWQFKNGELSTLGRLWQQIGGGIIAGMGIFIMSGMAMLLAK
ncbi:hypothetical protein [uncultured Eubacterium sp.]|uniref:hypothetical protein n=1 Tax=uncultured Eubacterium sp. TaxID=165185 RepID=UPI0025F4BAD2|nr:hypothetical protein [uncultured Eubacterium sp.]